MAKLTRDLIRLAMSEMGKKGGEAAAANMTPAQLKARATKASKAAAKARTAAARKRRTKQ
jgi:hypothetical protein